jgi:hypothetical protein
MHLERRLLLAAGIAFVTIMYNTTTIDGALDLTLEWRERSRIHSGLSTLISILCLLSSPKCRSTDLTYRPLRQPGRRKLQCSKVGWTSLSVVAVYRLLVTVLVTAATREELLAVHHPFVQSPSVRECELRGSMGAPSRHSKARALTGLAHLRQQKPCARLLLLPPHRPKQATTR